MYFVLSNPKIGTYLHSRDIARISKKYFCRLNVFIQTYSSFLHNVCILHVYFIVHAIHRFWVINHDFTELRMRLPFSRCGQSLLTTSFLLQIFILRLYFSLGARGHHQHSLQCIFYHCNSLSLFIHRTKSSGVFFICILS